MDSLCGRDKRLHYPYWQQLLPGGAAHQWMMCYAPCCVASRCIHGCTGLSVHP
jgi:hypothetical protein